MNKQLQKNINWSEVWEIVVEQCQVIVKERVKRMRRELIEVYHEIGGILLQHKNQLTSSPYGENWLEQMADDTGISKSVLYDSMAFAQTEPNLDKFLKIQNENISWSKIRKQYLINGKIEECEHPSKITVCGICRIKL